MDRMKILHTLLEREERRRDEALTELRAAERQADAAHEQADSLVTYRGEYRMRWAAQFAKSAPIEIVRCYHGFVARLDQAIAAQQGSVLQMEQRVKMARERLHYREVKVATVRRLIERRQAAALLQLQRREQKQGDEAAQRRAWLDRQALAAA